MFSDGLARVCSVDYAPPRAANLKDRSMHLTNFAVQKKVAASARGLAVTVRYADPDTAA